EVAGRLGAERARPVEAEGGRAAAEAADDLRESADAVDPGLLRAVDLRLRPAVLGADVAGHAGGAADVADHGQADEDHVVGELGRQPGRRAGAGQGRSGAAAGVGPGEAGVRAGVHVLSAADLRALPESVVCGVVPVGGDVQAL